MSNSTKVTSFDAISSASLVQDNILKHQVCPREAKANVPDQGAHAIRIDMDIMLGSFEYLTFVYDVHTHRRDIYMYTCIFIRRKGEIST